MALYTHISFVMGRNFLMRKRFFKLLTF